MTHVSQLSRLYFYFNVHRSSTHSGLPSALHNFGDIHIHKVNVLIALRLNLKF